MSGIVESVGSLGIYTRSDDRVVLTQDGRPPWYQYHDLLSLGIRAGATRMQIKCTKPYDKLPLEAMLTPSMGSLGGNIYFYGANRPERDVGDMSSEWDMVRRCWREPLSTPPIDRVRRVLAQDYRLTRKLTEGDIDDLTTIWSPFGWTSGGVLAFINQYSLAQNNEAGWFTGVRSADGRLCAAAKAEGLQIGNMNIIESTEWGTHPESRRMGLGTVAVAGLNANIISTPPHIPYCIFAEANMAPNLPGHRVARDTGFSTGADLSSSVPNGVLTSHVSVDGKLRDFLVAQLTPEDIAAHYGADMIDEIVSNFDRGI